MKADTYYLFENNKQLSFSSNLERLINKTIKTNNAMIYYNNILIWVQRP